MTSAPFFESLNAHLKAELPFVAYRKPNETSVKALLQKTNQLYLAHDFTESGFVFSPFDNISRTVLMPLGNSETISLSGFKASELEEVTTAVYKEIPISDKLHHINLVKKGVNEIEKGSLKKVVLSRNELYELNHSDPLSIFKRLLNTYTKGFVYCWYHPKVGVWLGATPETLIKVEGKRCSVMALAGTQEYNSTTDVVWQKKEIEEQQYVTDFIIDKIKSSLKDLTVSETETIKSGNLLHLRSIISGSLDIKNDTLKQLLDTLHPTPAVCGVPKQKAKQFILSHEHYDREFYTGFLGELNFENSRRPRTSRRNIEHRAYALQNRSTQLYVNLRCMQLKESKAILYVGGGVTKLSNPESEWEETVSKSLVIKTVL